jgi:hypothetical protein
MTTTNLVLDRWQPLVACLEFTVRNARDAWTVQTESKDWDFGPYIQAQYVDGEILAEITSSKFLEPELPIHKEHQLQFLGWQKPYGYDYPNWYKVVPHTVDGHEQIAKLWVKTLVEIYGMDERWRFEVAPLSIEFIRAWRWEMCSTRIVGRYQLVDRNGMTRAEQRIHEAQKAAQSQEDKDLVWEVRQLLRRGKTLKLAGTDLIRLAKCEARPEVVKIITELVYAGETELEFTVNKEDVHNLELYREIEFDDFAGLEYLERHADFDQAQNIWCARESKGRILRSVS